MDLTTLQRDAWRCAEAKGHHDALAETPITDQRLLALAGLANAYAALTDLAQEVKRHGIPDDLQSLGGMIENISDILALWLMDCRTKKGWKSDDTTPTAVRLTLLHTEVSEAYDVYDLTRHPDKAVEELADVLIRAAELAECLGGNLDQAVTEKMHYNWQRPKHFGTPLEGSGVMDEPCHADKLPVFPPQA